MEKENIGGQQLGIKSKRLFQRKKNVAEGNDYVFKNYQLQKNRLFQQRKNEEEEVFENRKVNEGKKQSEVIDECDDFVIISLNDLPKPQEQVIEHIESPIAKEQFNQIFVFDQDDEQIRVDEPIESGKSTVTSIFDVQYIKKESIGMSAKSTFRDPQNFDELMTPKQYEPHRLIEKFQKSSKEVEGEGEKKQEDLEKDETIIQKLQGIKIDKSTSNSTVSFNITNKQKFSISNLPSGIILKCIIKRTSSILNILSPEFDLYLANGLKHIISAKKYPFRNRQLFKFSTDPLNFNSSSQIATMHANVNHNLFWLLDNPKKIEDIDLSFIFLVIGYCKLKSTNLTRKFSILLPPSSNSKYQYGIDYDLNYVNYNKLKEDIDTELTNLTDWKGRQTNSIKNFVLADEEDPDYRYLQMRKESEHIFELTIQHPLSPLQAMAIAMSRFDAELK